MKGGLMSGTAKWGSSESGGKVMIVSKDGQQVPLDAMLVPPQLHKAKISKKERERNERREQRGFSLVPSLPQLHPQYPEVEPYAGSQSSRDGSRGKSRGEDGSGAGVSAGGAATSRASTSAPATPDRRERGASGAKENRDPSAPEREQPAQPTPRTQGLRKVKPMPRMDSVVAQGNALHSWAAQSSLRVEMDLLDGLAQAKTPSEKMKHCIDAIECVATTISGPMGTALSRAKAEIEAMVYSQNTETDQHGLLLRLTFGEEYERQIHINNMLQMELDDANDKIRHLEALGGQEVIHQAEEKLDEAHQKIARLEAQKAELDDKMSTVHHDKKKVQEELHNIVGSLSNKIKALENVKDRLSSEKSTLLHEKYERESIRHSFLGMYRKSLSKAQKKESVPPIEQCNELETQLLTLQNARISQYERDMKVITDPAEKKRARDMFKAAMKKVDAELNSLRSHAKEMQVMNTQYDTFVNQGGLIFSYAVNETAEYTPFHVKYCKHCRSEVTICAHRREPYISFKLPGRASHVRISRPTPHRAPFIGVVDMQPMTLAPPGRMETKVEDEDSTSYGDGSSTLDGKVHSRRDDAKSIISSLLNEGSEEVESSTNQWISLADNVLSGPLWTDFIRRGGEIPKAPRMRQADQVAEFVQALFMDKMAADEKSGPKDDIYTPLHDHFYDYLQSHYILPSISFKVSFEMLRSMEAHGDIISINTCLGALHSDRDEFTWRYIAYMTKIINDCVQRIDKKEGVEAAIRALYPEKSDEEVEVFVYAFMADRDDNISKLNFLHYCHQLVVDNKEPRLLRMARIIDKAAGSRTERQDKFFQDLLPVVVPRAERALVRRFFKTAAANTISGNRVPTEILATIAAIFEIKFVPALMEHRDRALES